jgi:hypothetical protein
MVNRKHTGFLSAVLFLYMLPGFFLYAQEVEPLYDEGDFFIGWDDGGPRFIQRLSWNHHELVLRYEVILEEQINGENAELLRQSSQENSLLVSLRPGRYRYRVEVYNLLNQLEYTMDWTAFEVFNALQPRIDTFVPEEFFPDTETQWKITINGQDIAEGADIMLRPRDGAGQGIRPQSMEVGGDSARLVFNEGLLAPGAYDVYIRNPGGLEASRGTFTVHLPAPPVEEAVAGDPEEKSAPVRFRRPDIIISAAYTPVIPLYGVLFVDNVFKKSFFPLSFAVRGGVVPFKWGQPGSLRHYLGAELGLSWYRLKEQKENYAITAQVFGAQINLLYQMWLPHLSMAINFRFGAGLISLSDFYFDYGNGQKESFSSGYLSLDAGLSFQWQIIGAFYIEAGADFTHILSSSNPSSPGYLRPVAGVRWQF